jgi:hypothetical protein
LGKKLLAFSRRLPANPNVFSPVNYRPTENCRTLVFDPTDGNNYTQIFDAAGIQYALGEVIPTGYHVIEILDADGPLVRYTFMLPDGRVSAKRHKSDPVGCVYNSGEIRFIGLAFQFIRDFETGERWEFIRGPAHEGEGESMTHPVYEVSR